MCILDDGNGVFSLLRLVLLDTCSRILLVVAVSRESLAQNVRPVWSELFAFAQCYAGIRV